MYNAPPYTYYKYNLTLSFQISITPPELSITPPEICITPPEICITPPAIHIQTFILIWICREYLDYTSPNGIS